MKMTFGKFCTTHNVQDWCISNFFLESKSNPIGLSCRKRERKETQTIYEDNPCTVISGENQLESAVAVFVWLGGWN